MAKSRKDRLPIPGDYQYRAMIHGNAIQRFWHESKKLAIQQLAPSEATDCILDVGCGSGVMSSYLGRGGATVVGIDSNSLAIEFATKQFARRNVRFELGFVDEDFGVDCSVDKIYCLEVIEHVCRNQARKLLANFHRLLKPGGKLLLTTPNTKSLWPIIEWGLDHFTSAYDLGSDEHVCMYDAQRLTEVCQGAGFRVDAVRTSCLVGVWLAPLSWKLARWLHDLELRSRVGWGAILLCVCSKPPAPYASGRR